MASWEAEVPGTSGVRMPSGRDADASSPGVWHIANPGSEGKLIDEIRRLRARLDSRGQYFARIDAEAPDE